MDIFTLIGIIVVSDKRWNFGNVDHFWFWDAKSSTHSLQFSTE